jgi:hypothetical protein
MKISNAFNPKSDHRNVRWRVEVPGDERLTGRLNDRKDTLSDAWGLSEWSFSFVSIPQGLELVAEFTP